MIERFGGIRMKMMYKAPELQIVCFASEQTLAANSLEEGLLGSVVDPVEPSAGTDIDVDLGL